MENVRPRARFYALLKLHYLNPFLEPKVEKGRPPDRLGAQPCRC